MGQEYIVDSFMTVVVGGVGSIFGTVVSALGETVNFGLLELRVTAAL